MSETSTGTRFSEPSATTTLTPTKRSSFREFPIPTWTVPISAKFGWTNDLQYFCDCSNAHYNSFQGTIKINAWQGWTLQASYTYQRSVADGAAYDGNYYESYMGRGPRRGE